MIILLLLFFLFSIVIFLLLQQFGRQQKLFHQKMDLLQKTIAESNQKYDLQADQLQITNEFEKTLKANKATLTDALFSLNYDLFELLSQNNLLNSGK